MKSLGLHLRGNDNARDSNVGGFDPLVTDFVLFLQLRLDKEGHLRTFRNLELLISNKKYPPQGRRER